VDVDTTKEWYPISDSNDGNNKDTGGRPGEEELSSIPSGAKMKFRGVVIGRYADVFTIRDRTRADYQVFITDNTSIKTHGGFLRSGKKYPVTEILRGFIVEVDGRGDAQGQLVAEKIRFTDSDMRAAQTTDVRVGPLETNQERMAGQMDEVYAVAAEVRTEAKAVNERVSALDDYDDLFNSDGRPAIQPTITAIAPDVIHYGAAFHITTPDAANIRKVVLIRPGAVTHSFDMEQRVVELAFSVDNGRLTPTAPLNGNFAPPGYYMVFILNSSGVPSVASFVRLR